MLNAFMLNVFMLSVVVTKNKIGQKAAITELIEHSNSGQNDQEPMLQNFFLCNLCQY